MALTLFTKDIQSVSKLDRYPPATPGMTEEKLKLAFDYAGIETQKFINETLIPEVETELAKKSGLSAYGAAVEGGYTGSLEQFYIDIASASQLTGDNLLINPFFRINQRGQTTYSNTNYTVDGWLWTVAAPTRSLTVNPSTVTIVNNASTTGVMAQKLEVLKAGVYTLSVYLNSEIIENKTFEWDGATLTEQAVSFGSLGIRLLDDFPAACLNIASSNTIYVRCVKLEHGEVSTIANDVRPKIATDLTECKRYLRLWTTADARTEALKEVGLMATENPTPLTITIGGVDYYAASAEL